jgi:hypothetical protein
VAVLSAAVVVMLSLLAAGSTAAALLLAREQARTEDERRQAVAERDRADRSAAAAQEHFGLALSTLNTLITKVQQQFGEKTGTLQLREQLTQTALADPA